MNLILNQNVIKILKDRGFYPDTMITALTVLFALQEGEIKLLDELDDNNSSQRVVLVYYDLVRKGVWAETPDGDQLFKMTDTGTELYWTLREAMHGTEKPTKEVSVDKWFNDWMELWPRGVKTGGKLVRSDAKTCLQKMKSFVKTYPKYTYTTIMLATKHYIDEMESKGYSFIKSATYFIDKKGEGSELAAACEETLHSDKQILDQPAPTNNFFI